MSLLRLWLADGRFSKIRAFVEAVERKGYTAAALHADVAVSAIARQVEGYDWSYDFEIGCVRPAEPIPE